MKYLSVVHSNRNISLSEPVTQILGGPHIYIEEGLPMNLTCIVKDSPEPPQSIFWHHQQQVNMSRTYSLAFYLLRHLLLRKYLMILLEVESVKLQKKVPPPPAFSLSKIAGCQMPELTHVNLLLVTKQKCQFML